MPKMQDTLLIPFAPRQLGSETVETVNGRDLHGFLAIRKDYSNWIKAQIKRGHFIENRDYIVLNQKGERENQWDTAIEYFFTFDAAKHIGMMSGAKKGTEVREYFIECERQLTRLPSIAPKTPAEMFELQAQMYTLQVAVNKDHDNRIASLEHTVASLQAERPPAGRAYCTEWLSRTRKPFLPSTMLGHFKAECKRRERPIPFRPASSQYEQLYYTLETLEIAYQEIMRQMLMFPGQERRRG